MGDESYKISLGVDLDTSDLKSQINKIDGKYNVKLGVDLKVNDIRDRITQYNKNTNNAKLKLGINLDTSDLKKQINNLNLGGTSGKGVAIPVDTQSLETSFKEVKDIITEIKNSIGTLDSGANMKSLLSSINQISTALDKASGKFEELAADLKILSGKDFNINLGISTGGSNNPIARNAAYGNKVRNETLPQLKQQAEALENYLKEYYKVADGFNAAQKLIQGTNVGNGKISLYDLIPKMLDGSSSLSSQMTSWKEYIDLIKEAASIKGIDLSDITSQFSKQSEELVKDAQDIQSGTKEAKEGLEQLKQIFGGNSINTEGLSEQLDSIVSNLIEIKNAIKRLSSNVSIDELVSSFNRLSESLEKIMTNAKLVQNVLGDGLSDDSVDNISNQAEKSANAVVQSEEKKRQAIKQTQKLVSDYTQKTIDNVSSERIGKYFEVSKSDSDNFRKEMDNLVKQWTDGKGNIVDLKIDTRTFYDKDAEENVERLRQAQVTYNNELGETIKKTIAWRQIGEEYKGESYDKKTQKTISVYEPIYGFAEVSGKYSKSLGKTTSETQNFVKQQKIAVSNLTNQINQLNRAANDQNAARPIKEQTHLTELASKYNEITSAIQRMESASSDTFVDEQNNVKRLISEFKSLISEYKNAENVSSKMKGTDFDSGLNIAKNDLEKFKAEAKDFPKIANTIQELDTAIDNVGDASSLNKFNDQLRVARSELAKIKTETTTANRSEKVGINVSGLESKIADLQRINPEINKFKTEIDGAEVSVDSLLKDLKNVNTQSDFSVVNSKWKAFKDAASAAGIAVAEVVEKTKSIKDIKLDIELENYDNQISQMDDKFDRLSSASKELCEGVEQVHEAYKKMELALEGTGDEVADKERLVQAEKEYAAALEKTNNLIRIQAREEDNRARKEKLENDIKLFQADIDSWLTNNSAATKKFGDSMLELRAKADGVDRVKLNGLIQQFKLIDKEAGNAGLKIQSFSDRIKTKAKEYMAYFSVAEIFMEVTQTLKRMFDTVVEIDTAMTGLYRVTDLTASQYDVLFDNMISSAKEYGATLNDIIDATTDWVRAGFDANTALGLAEVTTMYQHISDLDYNVAAENLITAYNGFKNELNGAFDGDTVSAVNYIADIFNELDNNFAVTSASLGEALTRSASALDLAGNSIQETAGMITGIVEVTQDPEKAGSALKVLSLRLRGMKGQLEELGEETDENVENISKMQGQILNMTGGKVNIFDTSGNFKSTYEIMKSIAEVWDSLSSIDQANLLETIAGKNRANDVASLLSNWKNVEAAVKSANEAEGSAARENAKYVDSLQGRLDKLTTAWQSFSETFMKSDFLKGGVSALTTFVELIEKLVDTLGTFGTIGFGTGIFSLFKNRGSILGDLSAFGSLASEVISSSGKLSGKFKDVGTAAKMAGGSITKGLTSSLSGAIGVIGLAVSAISLLYNWYKNVKEAAAEQRQETIRTNDAFLESASSFEKAYVKYSGKTELTIEEESELEAAIKGTADALGDKSSALQNIVDNSNDYLASLEAIANAERKAANDAAQSKLIAAEKELKEVAIGETFDGSEVNVIIKPSTEEDKIAKEVVGDYYYSKLAGSGRFKRTTSGISLDADASADEIVDYYYTLLKYQKALEEAELADTTSYDNVTLAIGKMSEAIDVYTNGVYDAKKAEYQLANGIPKTTEDYLNMRESILSDMENSGYLLDTRKIIASSLDSEYGQIFDLSSIEAQARKFVGLIQNYGDNEISTIETYLNMKTRVNNNDCTVGQYLDEFNKINDLTQGWNDEEKELFNTSFGFDTDYIKEQYDGLYDYLIKKFPKRDGGMSFSDYSHYKNEAKADIENFLKGLTFEQLEAVIGIKAEIDWENATSEDIFKQIEDRVKLNEALNFQANIEADTTALEKINEILTESVSAIGLSSEAIESLQAKYSDLDGYDPSTLFERTANGVKVNREELEKLEKKQNDLNKSKVQEYLDTLVNKYNNVTEEIDKCSNAGERAELLAEREGYKNKIEELATYQAQLEGVTGAYQDWINAQNTPEDYEGYEAVATGREDIQSEIDRGFIGNSTRKYIDLLSSEDLDGKSVDDYADAWKRLDDKITGAGYSINDFFTVNEDGDITSAGIDRFFKSLQTDFEGSVAKFDAQTEEWTYDFGTENLEKIKEKWGIGIEAIELLLEAAASAGYDVDWGGILDGIDIDVSNFETLVSIAESAQTAFNNLENVEDVNFNFTCTGVEQATSELEKARSTYINLITNDDGSVDINANGAEEMRVILSTLLIQKQQLEDSNIAINIDTSGLNESQQDIANAINAVNNFREKYKNLEIAVNTGQGIEEAKTELNAALGELQGIGDEGVDIAAQLMLGEGADASSLQAQLNSAIETVNGDIPVGFKLDQSSIGSLNAEVLTNFTPEATVKITEIDDSLVSGYTSTEKTADGVVKWKNDDKLVVDYAAIEKTANGIVKWSNNTVDVKTSFSASGTVNWTSGNKVKVDVVSEANGTANAYGTTGRAFKQGDWGIKGNGTALVGELGMETLVRDGKFYTIGDNGAEFINYKNGDIIFNHLQTQELFSKGKVTSGNGRGKMFANGSAFANGNYPSSGRALWTSTVTGSNFVKNRVTGESYYSNDSDKSKDKDFEEVLDWIEVILNRVERSIDKFDQQANNIYKNWSSRNNALLNQISEVNKEISIQQQAYNKYINAANGVGLDSSWTEKVRNGVIDIDTIKDEVTAKKIKSYQEYYEKALDCQDAIRELREEESKLYKQRFDNVATEYEGVLSIAEHEKNMLEEYISQSEAQAWLVSSKYYDALANNEQENISKLKEEKAALLSSFETAMNSGTIDKYSEAWYEMVNAVDEVTLAITEGKTALLEYKQTLQQLNWEVFDILQERISNVTEEADFLIELMSNSKLYEDNGQLTDNGKATMGLHGQNYNVYMHQADEYRKEVEELNKELEKDPYDQDLINRRDELLGLQRDSILAAEDEKNAIRDMVEEGIEYELDALQELIDKKNEELDSVKDLYDYNKKVKEQTKEIASLEKQMAAYSGDDSEEAKAKIQELKVSLEEAKTDLEETEYDKYISDTQKILDDLYLEYETILNERLDNLDALISDMILEINANASIISDTINTSADSVGYTLTESMNTIWSGANNVITTYGEKFSQAQTTTNNALNTINANLQNMITQLNSIANKNVQSASTSSAAHSSEANSSPEPTPPPTPPSDPAPTQADYTGVALAIINGNHDWGNGAERAQKLAEAGFDAAQIQGLVNELWDDKSVHSGGWQSKYGVGDLNQYSYKNYKTGAYKIGENQLAWTQEGRKQEFIVRPSDGAILTPLAKTDSVLNATASDNIWKMANSPSEFIRDNLNLGITNVPNNSNVNNSYVQNLDNVVFSFPNVQNYNELLSSMQKDKNFEKLILSMSIDRIAGGSSLAKGKSIR